MSVGAEREGDLPDLFPPASPTTTDMGMLSRYNRLTACVFTI